MKIELIEYNEKNSGIIITRDFVGGEILKILESNQQHKIEQQYNMEYLYFNKIEPKTFNL